MLPDCLGAKLLDSDLGIYGLACVIWVGEFGALQGGISVAFGFLGLGFLELPFWVDVRWCLFVFCVFGF